MADAVCQQNDLRYMGENENGKKKKRHMKCSKKKEMVKTWFLECFIMLPCNDIISQDFLVLKVELIYNHMEIKLWIAIYI